MITTTNIDLVALIEREAPIQVHSQFSVHGITELHCNCPWCPGTTDSFVISLKPDGHRFSHNLPKRAGCGRYGDAIDFIQEWKDLDFLDAVSYLNLQDGLKNPTFAKMSRPRREIPNAQWLLAAEEFALRCHRLLFSEHGERALAWLHERGFSDDTLLQFQIGFLPTNNGSKFHGLNFSEWGLQPHVTDKNQEYFYLHYGIVIPYYKGNKIHKLEIRKPVEDKHGKYQTMRGSVDTLFNQNALSSALPCVITEGAFDAMSGAQEAGDQAVFVATGGAKYSEIWQYQVQKSKSIIVAFDAADKDTVGEKYRQEWKKALPESLNYPPHGHDLNSMLKEHIDIVAWLDDALFSLASLSIQSKDIPAPSPVEDLSFQNCQSCGATTKHPSVEVCYWPLDKDGKYTENNDYIAVKCYCLKCDEELKQPRKVGAGGKLKIEDYWYAGEQTNYRAIDFLGLHAGKVSWEKFLEKCRQKDISRVIMACGVISPPAWPESISTRLIDVDEEIRENAALIIEEAQERLPFWRPGNMSWLLRMDSFSREFQYSVRELAKVQKKHNLRPDLSLYEDLLSLV